MSLAFPAIAAQIVRKRLIREWFRDIPSPYISVAVRHGAQVL